MNSRELVRKVIKGEEVKKTPVYGWVSANLDKQISERFGSVRNFEDHYEYDLAHIFGGPSPYNTKEILPHIKNKTYVTPEQALEMPFREVTSDDYIRVKKNLDFYQKDRQRFCYVQTPGIFESLNDIFGIENHLMYMALYPEKIKEVYRKQALWNKNNAENLMDLGVDMIHISDDWGAQNSMMFSADMWKEYIFPNYKIMADAVKKRDVFLSLHSDGNINAALDGVVELGFDVVHPYQEAANMSYDTYLDKYQDKFAILGGLCIQTTLGFNDYANLESEIRRIFKTLKGKRWIVCTTHFVQDHCSVDELVFAYDLVNKLAKE
ncbi:MAG: hypothetical protein KAG94_00545 [Clostridiales bacterium]|nr:hypothetical protein [Clostridiales bacterium]